VIGLNDRISTKGKMDKYSDRCGRINRNIRDRRPESWIIGLAILKQNDISIRHPDQDKTIQKVGSRG
jgi:hypothetical protein